MERLGSFLLNDTATTEIYTLSLHDALPISERGVPPVSPAPDISARVREAALLEGDFVLSSGKRSPFYVDKSLFSTEPSLLRDIAAELSGTLPPGVDRLAGVELGAVPLVVATALQTGLPYVIVRKAAKEYGGSAGRAVEGVVRSEEHTAELQSR